MRRSVGAVVWLTGLSGSGKSTLARELERRLSTRCPVTVLDGDDLRQGLCSDLGFDRASRAENARRVAEVAALLGNAGLVCVAALIAPYSVDREYARVAAKRHGVSFLEVFVDAPIEACERRDPKGLYRLARAGTIRYFTGLSDPYETPLCPDVHVRTDQLSAAECASLVLAKLMPPGPPGATGGTKGRI